MDIKKYSFGNFQLDCQHNRLYQDKDEVDMHDKSLLLLTLLAKASPQTVSKDELHCAIWPETIVSDWSLSRLVSDTRRALGEDNDQQNIIKTDRGKGFSIPDAVAIPDKLETIKSNRYSPYVFAALFLGSVIIGVNIWQQAHHQRNMHEAISNIKAHQDNAYTAFIAQAKRRNELVERLEARLYITRTRQFELFFRHVADKMNEEEKFICQQMRTYSDAGLYKNNSAVLDILSAHTTIYNEIASAKKLAQHLRVWVDKYENLFTKRKDMCLIYVGVEDGVPYPSEVDEQINQWLEQN